MNFIHKLLPLFIFVCLLLGACGGDTPNGDGEQKEQEQQGGTVEQAEEELPQDSAGDQDDQQNTDNDSDTLDGQEGEGTSDNASVDNDRVGIPEPAFGLNEIAPSTPVDWQSEVSGFYYIDPDHPSADDGNTYGTPTNPRESIPSVLLAGDTVEVHGIFSTPITIENIHGTQGQPIFIRGVSSTEKPIFLRRLLVRNVSYLIIENIKTEPSDASATGCCGINVREGSHHVAIRNSEFSGAEDDLEENKLNLNRVGSIGVGTWGYAGAEDVNNIVISHNYIHDMGNLNDTGDQDAHGITVNGTVNNLWILNNEIRRCSGDGLQIEAQSSRGRENIHHIYVAGNEVSHNKQTGLWIKHAQDVIFSGNHVSHHAVSSSNLGSCIGFQYAADHFWFINNTLHDCAMGIGVMSGSANQGDEAFYIGNLIYDIYSDVPNNPHGSGGIVLRMNGVKHHVINNTIYNADRAISAPIQSTATLYLYNNILSESNLRSGNTIYLESVSSNLFMDSNLIYANDGFDINWSGAHYESIEQLYSARSVCENCLDSPIEFVSVEEDSLDFRLSDLSTNLDFGTIDDSYAYFELRYGLSILQDINGNSRASDENIKVGALE